MTHNEERPPGTLHDRQDRETVERLLLLSGPPSPPPKGWIDSLKAVVRPAWQEALRQQHEHSVVGGLPRKWKVGGLLAATLLLVVALSFFWERATPNPSTSMATHRTVATIEIVRDPGACTDIMAGDALPVGTVVRTCPGVGMALRLTMGASLRLGADTEVHLLGPNRLALEKGSIYLDCNPQEVMEALEVVTPFGSLYDLGTQFLVTVEDSKLSVQVREGMVELRRDGSIHRALPGTTLLARHGEPVQQQQAPLAFTNSQWDWVLSLAPTFQLDGQPLGEFLEWIRRETGYTPRFADAQLAAKANGIILRGKIDGLRPDEALDAVLPTTGLQHRVEHGKLVIWHPSEEPPKP